MECERAGVRAAIDSFFVAGEAPREFERVREHLFACGGCRSYYDKLMSVGRRLEPQAPLSSAELAWVEQMILREVTPRAPRASFLPGLRLFLPSAAGALLALVLLALMPALLHGVGGEDEFRPRGDEALTSAGIGVRALCVTSPEGASPWVRSVFPARGDNGGPCRLADTLHFTYSNATSGTAFDYLFVLGLDEDGEAHWYYPSVDESESVRIDPGAADRPLRGGIALARSHVRGRLEVVALFSRVPLSRVTVEHALDTGLDLHGEGVARALGVGDDVGVTSVFVDLAP